MESGKKGSNNLLLKNFALKEELRTRMKHI